MPWCPDPSSLCLGSTRTGHPKSYQLARVPEPVPLAGREEAESEERSGLASREAALPSELWPQLGTASPGLRFP